MHQRFVGKVAVVTGGNSGIGLATAKAFAAEGARVVITGRSADTLQVAAKEIGGETLALQADVADLAQISAMAAAVAERFGRVDALYVNAGVGAFLPFTQVTEELWDRLIDTNLKGAFFTVQRLLPLMHSGGAIVFCASIAAHFGPPAAAVYAASKAGLSSLTKSLGHELLAQGIRVNCVSPGLIQTPIMTRDPHPDPAARAAMFENMVAQLPMKRIGQPEEVAQTVLFLASAQASLINGMDVLVDGGQISFK